MIDGAAGVDTAVLVGAHTAYRLVYQGGGAAVVSGPDEVDMLRSVERVQFGDGTYATPTGFFDPAGLATARSGRRRLPAAGRARGCTRVWRRT